MLLIISNSENNNYDNTCNENKRNHSMIIIMMLNKCTSSYLSGSQPAVLSFHPMDGQAIYLVYNIISYISHNSYKGRVKSYLSLPNSSK